MEIEIAAVRSVLTVHFLLVIGNGFACGGGLKLIRRLTFALIVRYLPDPGTAGLEIGHESRPIKERNNCRSSGGIGHALPNDSDKQPKAVASAF
jgi:hypothetical protein